MLWRETGDRKGLGTALLFLAPLFAVAAQAGDLFKQWVASRWFAPVTSRSMMRMVCPARTTCDHGARARHQQPAAKRLNRPGHHPTIPNMRITYKPRQRATICQLNGTMKLL